MKPKIVVFYHLESLEILEVILQRIWGHCQKIESIEPIKPRDFQLSKIVKNCITSNRKF